MIFVVGGAYQGKSKFVQETLQMNLNHFYYCASEPLLTTSPVICGLDHYLWYCIEQNIDVDLHKLYLSLENKVVIIDDITGGIVPLTKEERAWRMLVGKVIQYFMKQSQESYYVIASIPRKIKGK